LGVFTGQPKNAWPDLETHMKLPIQLFAFPLVALAALLGCSDGSAPTQPLQPAFAAGGRSGFGFNGTVRGFPFGAVFLTGGGSYDASTASNTIPDEETSVKSGGGFRCTEPVAQGPLTGCAKGEGVRWDTVQLLASTPTGFKCNGADALKNANTDAGTVVLLADFYRAGDGVDESFTAQIIVSESDIADDIPGVQNLWVQGVGCATAITNFN
jgi:hypothetical protein